MAMNKKIVLLMLISVNMAYVSTIETPMNCGSIQADIHFLLDSSGSVGSSNFEKQKNFVARFAQSFTIGPKNVQIGVTTFSTTTHPQFYMNARSTQSSLMSAIKAIPYQSGNTHTDEALKWIDQHAFTSTAGDRSGVTNILIVMTDGQSNNPHQTAIEAQKIHGHKVKVFAIAIGHGIKQTELDKIASDHAHTFTVQNFDALNTLQAELQSSACKVSFTGLCVDSTFINCTDSHVCTNQILMTYCPITCGLCVPATTPPPCLDATFIKCSDSHVCSNNNLKTFCPVTCGLCASNLIIVGK